MTEYYGKVRVSKIIKTVDDLRTAIQKEGTPDILAAWDRLEQWIDFFYDTRGKTAAAALKPKDQMND